ncbi:hypothetical protein K470DRAFT_266930 [Piedraia hortae CBS 480.64]|uniref:Peroxisomal membrane protein PEX13 n=1 Tax=Piedraia hortae CBS 480.64 TaxID=1314780 RepID=A0A6A7BPN6_9PEZI|nr:hypothetical protein K470DRAFT_266930 [Piedraia hortae CBS 480.64]
MASPPKPWERARTTNSALPSSTTTMTSSAATPAAATTATTGTTTESSATPALPSRPDSLNALAARTASNYSSPLSRTGAYGSPYGGLGGGMYNRFGGGMYGGGYGGVGAFGSGYGGMYGQGLYGQGMYGGGPFGQQDQSLSQTMSMSTQATFQMIESIVGAFGGFAQMLESTYMATHSSFFAMVSVAEQLGNLRQTLGSILGIYALIRWIRTGFARLTGRPLPASSKELTPANFASFSGGGAVAASTQPKPSRKPFFFFLAAIVGLPYLMGKLIRSLAANEAVRQQQQMEAPLDPSKLDFCRVLYDYEPPAGSSTEGIDMPVKKGDLVAVLSKLDPMGKQSDWWRCRARDGRMGYLPSPYLETIRSGQQGQIAAAPAKEDVKETDSGAQFQKGMFYS